MSPRFLITLLALALLLLALAGWIVQAARWPTRTLAAS
jgi:hypothetical protein